MFTSWEKSEKSDTLHFEIDTRVYLKKKSNQTNLNLVFFYKKKSSAHEEVRVLKLAIQKVYSL